MVADAKVRPLRPGTGDVGRAAGQALAAVHRHLDRCKLAPNTARACRRRARACTAWLAGHASEHPDFLFT